MTSSASLLNVNSSSVLSQIDRDSVSSSLIGGGSGGGSGGSISDPAIEQLNEQISINTGKFLDGRRILLLKVSERKPR